MDAITLPLSFGEEHFGTAELGDERRRQRLIQLANQIARHPEGTLPDKLQDPANYQAMYRLCKNPAVTHATVIAPHCQRTLERMRQHPPHIP
jgi:Transposase DNA-binding